MHITAEMRMERVHRDMEATRCRLCGYRRGHVDEAKGGYYSNMRQAEPAQFEASYNPIEPPPSDSPLPPPLLRNYGVQPRN